jgi:type II secretory pathway pseudopilin PulG
MKFRPTNNRPDTAAFTMVEIAICLAIIGFALVAIIGVLPLGMNTQRDNREETIINQDATVLLEAVRNGTHGANDLTNYVYAITNHWGFYNANGGFADSGQNGFSFVGSAIPNNWPLNKSLLQLTNGAHIVGLLSTPEFMDGNGKPISDTFGVSYYSNHVVAYVRSLSGLAAEKPPQDNQIMKEDTFSYRILCVNAPVPVDTNVFNLAFAQRQYVRQLSANLHELRMTFLWPQLPNGKLGNGHQTFRATIAGQLLPDRNNNNLYFYQSQSFTNAP